MKAGRKTDYSEKTLVRANGYIDACGEIYDVKERPTVKDGKVHEETYVKPKIKLPTVEGLALELDVHRDTLYEWAKQHPLFSDTLEKLKKKQAEMLMQYGLSGDYNPAIAKLILSANHGMKEKTETDVTSKGEKITSINYIVPNGDNDTTNE